MKEESEAPAAGSALLRKQGRAVMVTALQAERHGLGWSVIVGALKSARTDEHNLADRAMQRLFRRLERCQRTEEVPGGGVCGKCLLAAVTDWRRFTAKKASNASAPSGAPEAISGGGASLKGK